MKLITGVPRSGKTTYANGKRPSDASPLHHPEPAESAFQHTDDWLTRGPMAARGKTIQALRQGIDLEGCGVVFALERMFKGRDHRLPLTELHWFGTPVVKLTAQQRGFAGRCRAAWSNVEPQLRLMGVRIVRH